MTAKGEPLMSIVGAHAKAAVFGMLSAVLLSVSARAAAEPHVSVEVSGKVGYATNPYLEYETINPDTDVVTATMSITPTILFPGETGKFRLSGNFQHTEYSRHYRSKETYGLSAGFDKRLSERLTIRGGANFDSAVVGSDELIVTPVDGGSGADPGQPPVIDDITNLGSRQRRQSFRAMTALSYQASPGDLISFDMSAALTRYPNPTNLDEFNYFRGTLGYSTEVSADTFVGVTFGASRSNYLNKSVGDGTVLTPQLTASTGISERWSLHGSIGASIARINDLTGKTSQTSLAGSFGACRKDERSNFCLSANRSAMPTSFGGIRTQTGIGTSFGYRLGEFTDISANANYSWADQSILGAAGSVEYFTASMTLNRRLSERVTGFISDGYSDSYGGNIPREANVQVNAGIRVTLGDRQ